MSKVISRHQLAAFATAAVVLTSEASSPAWVIPNRYSPSTMPLANRYRPKPEAVKAYSPRASSQSHDSRPSASPEFSSRSRLQRSFPRWDQLDRRIAGIALPSAINLLIFPLVSLVDTYWVGQMGDALALAGQGAANQVFSSIFWVIAFFAICHNSIGCKSISQW